ncbi:MAG: pitrilysin family protein [Candidatus Omnitrophota bacterium]|nr:pitrilysin family protein [Candidatus Omnitrophota bacterium]
MVDDYSFFRNAAVNMGKIIRYAFKIFIISCFLVLTACFSFSGEFTPDYHELVLDNGARIVCRYMPGSPLVAIQIRVLSGLSNEGKYAGSGISHFLEHLLFKGAGGKTSSRIRSEIKMMGGLVNASTGLDSVEYHMIVPNEKFEQALDLLTDMVMDPVFSGEEMETEREVILKEIKLRNDDPVTRRMRLLFSLAYRENVYRHPVIGSEELFKDIAREDIIEYHGAVYTPDRIVMGIAGGIPPDTALEAAEKKLEGYRRGGAWQPEVIPEPEQVDVRKIEFPADVVVGYMAIGFHTSSVYSPDLYPGDVLSILLGEGNDSRLYRSLVKEKQLLYTVSSLNYTPKYPGLFVITGIGPPEKLEEARREVFEIIDGIKNGRIEDSEIKRARNSVISDYLHSHERVKSVASSMTNSEILTGDPTFFEKYVEEVKKVKKRDIRQVASEYLKPGNSTTVFLVPRYYSEEEGRALYEEKEGIDPSWKRAGTYSREDVTKDEESVVKVRDRKGKMIFRGYEPERSEKESPGKRAEKTPAIGGEMMRGQVKAVSGVRDKFVELKNGMKIIVRRKDRLPLVSVTLAVSGGLRAEDTENNGISNLTASLLLKGTKKRKESEIIPAIEAEGGIIGAFSGFNSLGVSMDIMAGDLGEGLDIFEDVVKNSVFPREEITKQKKKIIAAIKEQKKDIFGNGMIHLRKLLYGDHPYAMRIKGEVRTVEPITRENIAVFYRERFVPANAVITVVGDVDVEATANDLKRRFLGWKGKVRPLETGPVRPLREIRREDLVMEKEQALFLAGFQGTAIDEKKKYALSVISSLLSGSDGLLYSTAREKEGITYTSGAVSVPEVDRGYFLLYVATTEENIEKAGKTVFDVLDKIKNGDFSEEEILSSKNRLITQHAYSLESKSSMSMKMALDELYGLGFLNYETYQSGISAVTREEIISSAREILDGERAAVIAIHSEK